MSVGMFNEAASVELFNQPDFLKNGGIGRNDVLYPRTRIGHYVLHFVRCSRTDEFVAGKIHQKKCSRLCACCVTCSHPGYPGSVAVRWVRRLSVITSEPKTALIDCGI